MQWFKQVRKSGSRGYDTLAKQVIRPCRMWIGPIDKQGWGRTRFILPDGRVETFAHRVAFFKASGTLPRGSVVKHVCGHFACIEPAHLVIGVPPSKALEMSKSRKKWYQLSPSELSRLRATFT